MSSSALPLSPLSRAQPNDGGAITIAAQWCAAARNLPGPTGLMAFGTRERAFVLVGEAQSLCLQRYGDEPVSEGILWGRVEEFCESRQFLAGYIGFDAVWPDGTVRPGAGPTAEAVPTLHFWEPQGVIRIDAARPGVAEVAVVRDSRGVAALQPRSRGAFEAVPMGGLDGDLRRFEDMVSQTIASIRRGERQRLTLARRVELPPDLDLLGSFAAPPVGDSHDVGRSFYLATPALELAGHSPELLGCGDRQGFVCYKLSGTGRRHADAAQDARLRAELLGDAKVLREHAMSIESTRRALELAGTVSAGPMEVLERRGLRHLLTPLTVAVRPGTPWSTILKSMLPSGAQPRIEGLQSLDELERISRGAYYGIIGLRTPDGRFEFSQVLRTLFRDRSGVYTFVGAAVTGDSTVQGESDETRLKLDDVVAMRAVAGQEVPAPPAAS